MRPCQIDKALPRKEVGLWQSLVNSRQSIVDSVNAKLDIQNQQGCGIVELSWTVIFHLPIFRKQYQDISSTIRQNDDTGVINFRVCYHLCRVVVLNAEVFSPSYFFMLYNHTLRGICRACLWLTIVGSFCLLRSTIASTITQRRKTPILIRSQTPSQGVGRFA